MFTKGLYVFLALVASAAMTALVRRRARAQEARGGCVACGSQELERVDGLAHCRACGYAGAADGGGALSEDELGAIHSAGDSERRR
ncbi:MAG: hypothetical protein H0T76_28475 [Nannocystis sp.]|nr:hypothetical protein [Nannocystis sp.]MBA3550430.1 hypothetical protein [Nannocystis sp.]